MKSIIYTAIILVAFQFSAFAGTAGSISIKFADEATAAELLLTEDAFTESWSQFDIDSRLGKADGSKKDLFSHIKQQVRKFEREEVTLVNDVFHSINKRIVNLKLQVDLPETITLIKTTGAEEGGAGAYTRGDYIVLTEMALKLPYTEMEKIMIHELFHLLSRKDESFRAKMYGIIGFSIGNSVDYPEKLASLRITNPDAPQTDSYLSFEVDGRSGDYMMILYSDKAYEGGSFFNYLKIGFLLLTEGEKKTAKLVDGAPVVLAMEEVAGPFFEKVGKNTQYIIHPEEIMADNFAMAVLDKKELPSQWIIDKIISSLQ